MRTVRAVAVALVLLGASFAVAPPAGSVANAAVRCKTVAGAARLTPRWQATPGPVEVDVNAFRVASCNHVGGIAGTASGMLRSPSASCPLAPTDRLRGPVQIDWRSGAVTYIKAARLASTVNPDDPFEVRLDGRVTGGSQTGATLRVLLDLVPASGDCGSGVTAVTIGNTRALTIGGPYASCDTVAASASLSPGLATEAAPQHLHFESFAVSGCQAADTARAASIIGALDASAPVSCPPGKQQRFFGMLEVDWSNHFVSILKRAHLASTNNPDDPYELSLHGVITSGADAGAFLRVVLHATPTGDCASGVTSLSLANVGPFSIT